ncbi:hypothetical protein SAMN05660748_1861 [Blastococcus aggregatus]|uniref:Excreted virulence factor EspC, type VII ESX diderm n=1 Tax=Blastococcus aggregatus TaxID=38502 RepID=A0A285V559_9ACTN|nr:hypothetical protein [Blastococcus aggregatus]SOC49143.1 hypothetical protein SAMN05660748_1861 [Blastococcus aggregatus]
MSIELPAEEVRALGRSLTGRGDAADEVRSRLGEDGDVEGPLRAPVALFLECQAAVATALAGELRRLGATVTGVADSWVEFDAALLPADGTPGR